MNNRERLIDLIKKAEKQELLDLFTADLDEAVDMSGGTQFNGSVEYLADYLISNGVVVIPSKGCEYCKGRAYSKKPLTVTTIYGRTIKLPFNFCPKCGRRIKNDMKQGESQ